MTLTVIVMVSAVFLAGVGAGSFTAAVVIYVKQYRYIASYLYLFCVFVSPAALAYGLFGGSTPGKPVSFAVYG